MNLFEKVFGTHSERELKMIYPIVDKIEKMRPEMVKLSDEELRDKTRIFKERLAGGETLDDILPEAFAVVRGGSPENSEHGAFSCTAYRRYCASSGQNFRDAYR